MLITFKIMLVKFFYSPYFNQKCWVDSSAAYAYSYRICPVEFFLIVFKFPFNMTLFLSKGTFEYSFQQPPQQRTVQSQIICYHCYDHSKQVKVNKQHMDRCCVSIFGRGLGLLSLLRHAVVLLVKEREAIDEINSLHL